MLRHLAYAGGWKKFEPLWDFVIRIKRISSFLPLLEGILNAGEVEVQQEGIMKKQAHIFLNSLDS